jgi:hypothetical protein
MARTEVVAALWRYIKSNELQKPSDKRIIVCDAALAAIFNGEQVGSEVRGYSSQGCPGAVRGENLTHRKFSLL